jgi:hypothetical protein
MTPPLSLLGGPLHRLGCRLGLVKDGTNTMALGLVLGGLPWLCVVLLAVFEGVSQHVFSLSVVGGHIRLLVAAILPFVPLLLFKYPATELATKFITRLTGM